MVWNINFIFFHIGFQQKSQLTITNIFFRGVAKNHQRCISKIPWVFFPRQLRWRPHGARSDLAHSHLHGGRRPFRAGLFRLHGWNQKCWSNLALSCEIFFLRDLKHMMFTNECWINSKLLLPNIVRSLNVKLLLTPLNHTLAILPEKVRLHPYNVGPPSYKLGYKSIYSHSDICHKPIVNQVIKMLQANLAMLCGPSYSSVNPYYPPYNLSTVFRESTIIHNSMNHPPNHNFYRWHFYAFPVPGGKHGIAFWDYHGIKWCDIDMSSRIPRLFHDVSWYLSRLVNMQFSVLIHLYIPME